MRSVISIKETASKIAFNAGTVMKLKTKIRESCCNIMLQEIFIESKSLKNDISVLL